MLKRNIYFIAIGLALAHFSIAETFRGGTLKFLPNENCVMCTRVHQADNEPKFPSANFSVKLNTNLYSSMNQFTYAPTAHMPQWPQIVPAPSGQMPSMATNTFTPVPSNYWSSHQSFQMIPNR